MAVIANLDVLLGARTEKFDTKLQDASNSSKRFRADVDSIQGDGLVALGERLDVIRDKFVNLVPELRLALAVAAEIAAIFNNTQSTSSNKMNIVAAATAKEMAVVALETKIAATEAREFATAMTVASLAARQSAAVPLTQFARLPGPAMAAGVDDVIDAEFELLGVSKQVDNSVIESTASFGSMRGIGIAAGVGIGVAIVGVASAALAAAHAISEVRKEMQFIDETTDAAHRLGMSFHEVVVARRSLGETSGLDDGAIDASMQKLQLNLREASKGSGDLHELLSSVGVDAGQLLETGPVEQMKVLSAAMQEMKNPADQMNLAMELFGKQGVALVASLRDGPEHMAEMERHTIAWGLSLSDTQAEQVGAANDAWQQVTDIATGAWRQIAAEVSPVLTVIAEEIMAFAGPLEGWHTGLSFVVDGFVSVTGWVYDLYEVVTLTHSVMQKLVMLDFSGVGDSIESALSFDTADKWQAKINDARRAASEAAENALVNRGFESQAEEIEKQKAAAKEAQKAAEETRKAAERAAEEKRKAEEQAQERLDDHLNKIREEIEMAREIARLRTEGFSEADARRLTQQAKEINELITMGADGQLAASLVNERAQLEAEQRKLEQAQKDSETSVSATSAEVGSKEAYQIMIGARNDQLKEAQKQTSLQQQLVYASQEQTRAIQAISPMRAIR